MGITLPDQPQAGSGNPVLDEIDSLSPQAKSAMWQAHQAHMASSAVPTSAPDTSVQSSLASIPGGAPPSAMAVPGAQDQPQPITQLRPTIGTQQPTTRMPSMNAPSTGSTPAPSTPAMAPLQPTAHQQQLTHLEDGPPNGMEEKILGIQNPFLRNLARVGSTAADVVASGLFPNFGQFIPGTSAHHGLLVHEAQNAVANDQAAETQAASLAKTKAETENQEAIPELNRTKQELAQEKQRATEKNQQDKINEAYHAHGFDENGDPLPYEQLPEKEKAVYDLKAAQQELTEANAALSKAKRDNIPTQIALQTKRVEGAAQAREIAMQRLAQSAQTEARHQAEYNANYLGTDAGGKEALPGVPAGDDNKPIGLKTAAITKPTAATKGAGEQGGIIKSAGDELIKAIDAHKNSLGNLSSYWHQYTNGTPIADPDTARLMAQIASFAALQPRMHGMRGGQVMREFEKMVGGVPKDAEALKAAIQGIQGTAGIVQKAGEMKTVQPHPSDPALKAYADKYFGGDIKKAQDHIATQK